MHTGVGFCLLAVLGFARDAHIFPAQEPPAPAACIASWPEVVQNAGAYDHVIHLASRCTSFARCDAASGSNPPRLGVVVAPGQEVRVLVLQGSPEPRFVPRVACRFEPRAHPVRDGS